MGGLVVHQDGTALWQTLDDTLQSQGVLFCGLDTAVQQHAELVKTHFMTEAVPVATSKFTLHARSVEWWDVSLCPSWGRCAAPIASAHGAYDGVGHGAIACLAHR